MHVATIGPRIVVLSENSACGVKGCTNITNVAFEQKGLHLTHASGLVRVCRTCLRRLLGEVSDGSDRVRPATGEGPTTTDVPPEQEEQVA